MTPSVLYQDNQSTTKLNKNERRSSSSKTKHIDNRFFYIHDKVKKGEIEVRYCDTEHMLADAVAGQEICLLQKLDSQHKCRKLIRSVLVYVYTCVENSEYFFS